ncbi:hypothetical protein Sme01_56870 [Sphaerisporangium melleum]|uniref:Uncharacterized protein n=1 Tax=Sphaerisporangium melleum TaxID=321316 RepID=A0A917R836_9ACTN|nr:hypothetical protein GCM10007964_40750 [Sphaerisporangium melleum]GII73211.1 hypothetical protein Sme01_56870 [Sphaerisporangium melleum]
MVLSVLLAAPAWAADIPDIEDEQLVYCLSSSHRDNLASAAAALDPRLTAIGDRLAPQKSGTLSLEQWRAGDPAAFAKACRALTAAVPALKQEDPPNPLWNALSVVFTTLSGGLIALVAAEWRTAANAGVERAVRLGDLADDFFSAAGDYAEARSAGRPPSAQAFDTAHTALVRELDRVRRHRPQWPKVAAARRTVQERLSRQEADQGAEHVREPLEALRNDLSWIDGALRRPWIPFRKGG